MNINKSVWKKNGAYGLFWSWHIIYSLLALAVFIPYLLFPMIQDAIKGVTPWHYTIYTFLIVILPFISIYLGGTRFRKQPKNLMKYFYGFEMPLLFFVLFRIFTLRYPHAGIFWLFLNIVIGLSAWMIFLWWQSKTINNNKDDEEEKETDINKENTLPFNNNYLALSAATVLAMIGLYFGLLLVLVAIPTAVNLLKELLQILESIIRQGIGWDIISFAFEPLFYLSTLFFFFTASLFIALPFVMIKWYIREFIQRFRAFINTNKAKPAIALVLVVLSLNISGFMIFNQQSQQEVLTMLDEQIKQPEQKINLLRQAQTIKKALVNSYIAPYRYVSPIKHSNFLEKFYSDAFDTERNAIQMPQTIFNSLAKPFLYDGKWSDKEKAKAHYEYFFDTSIEKEERETILNAIKYTWETDGNEASLLHAASHYVHLNKQDIQISEQNGVATVTVTDTLENITYENQEVVIHFSLPEDTVITGLWLSDEADKLHKYPAVVAPKGAAQAVYKAEVKRRVDPALLEQVGPYQYRMRIYPIPAKSPQTGKAEPFYMQFEYQAIVKNQQNGLKIPSLLEKRNIFWDSDTYRTVNDIDINSDDDTAWIPQHIQQFPLKAIQNRSFMDNNKLIQALPRQHNKEQAKLNTAKRSFKLQVLIDGSYSMRENKALLLSLLKHLEGIGIRFDSYFCRQQCTPLAHFSALDQQTFYGNSQTHDHIAALMKINSSTAKNHNNNDNNDNNAVLILTDEGSYELGAENNITELESPVPVWLLHLTNSLPYAYDDKVLDLIYRSKGGISKDLLELLARLNPQLIKQAAHIASDAKVIGISEDYVWIERKVTDEAIDIDKAKQQHNSALAKIVAAYRIKSLMQTMDMRQLDQLDAIHALAKQQQIVTHYSSMLVLVNDRQKEALKKAEASDDRFEREVENGEQDSSTPSDLFSVSAVPEPEEWALILLISMMLLFVWRRKGYPLPNMAQSRT